ncbi:DMT family transporter [Pseudonocardia spirodelae]|uniref:DMT family transporter n=1 Tax=Pseudonocardia spirodelae TaxID=3133431 RepID=A0ABU8TBZ3_9PSEU
MTSSTRLLPVAAAAVTVVLWASAFVGIRAVGHDLSPGALALGRMTVGAATLTVVLAVVRARRRGAAPPLPRGRLLASVAIWGAAWFGAYNLVLNAAERHLDAGTTALLVNVAPVVVAVLAGLLLGEGFPLRLLIGMGVAFAGVVLIAAATSAGGTDPAGMVQGLLAALLYAGAAVAQKRLLPRVDALTMTWTGALAGAVVLSPFAPALLSELPQTPPAAVAGVLYLGVFPTAVAFLTWGYALIRTTAGRLAASTYAIPPLVVALSWALLGEVPAPVALLGGVLCLTGVAVATRRGAPRGSVVRPIPGGAAVATLDGHGGAGGRAVRGAGVGCRAS